MKIARINYTETDYYGDENIRDTFLVEYDNDFAYKLDKLERFETIIHYLAYDEEYDDDGEIARDENITEDEIELGNKYFDGSVIEAICSYIPDLFNVVPIEDEIEREW